MTWWEIRRRDFFLSKDISVHIETQDGVITDREKELTLLISRKSNSYERG
jgi:hypothetical protein